MSIRGMDQATVTMNQLQQQIDMIGNNVSNSSTAGYKSKQAEFSSLLFQQINNMTDPRNATGRSTPEGIRAGTGARLGAINANANMGALNETDRDLDVALLEKNLFFEVLNQDDAVQFTRDGSFYLQPVNDTEVEIVTKDGHQIISDEGESIRFTAENINGINIQSDGTVIVHRDQGNENAGRISVVSIDTPRILESVGNNNYRVPVDAGVAVADVVQGVELDSDVMQSRTLEMSNVDIADEMTSLINAQRAYQLNARTISMADEMQGLINQMR